MSHLVHYLLKHERIRFVSDYFDVLNSFCDSCNNITTQFKGSIARIFWHNFCRSSEFEHNKRLNFKDKPFEYFRLFLYLSKKIMCWLYLVILFSILNKFVSNCVVCRISDILSEPRFKG